MDKVKITRLDDGSIDFEGMIDPKKETTGDDMTNILLVVFDGFCAILNEIKDNTKKSNKIKERERYDNIIMDIHRVLDKIAKFD